MAGRRENGYGSVVEGFQTGDHSGGKSMVSKDHKRKKDRSRSQKGSSPHGVSYTLSPPMRKNNTNRHYFPGGGKHSSQQRTRNGIQETIDVNELEFIEKEILAKDKKRSSNISLSHLLNFTVARERNYDDTTNGKEGSGYRKTRRHNNYNKEQFLQANCQFVVKESEDYSVHLTQSDLLVDWNNIEQIRLFCHEIPSCPVCLYLPTAAKITRCGHVFCSSCILHYLTLSEKKWRKCPICFESIYKQDLKSVTTFASKRYEINDMISMTLMKKKKGTTIAMPCTLWDESCEELQVFNDDQNCRFSKLVVANRSQILANIIEPERLALQNQLATLTTDEESERCFVDTALQDLQTRTESVVKDKAENIDKHDGLGGDSIIVQTSSDEEESRSDRSLEESTTGSCVSGGGSPGSSKSLSPRSEYVYFYQSTDGQHLYMHPLNGKALVTEYGSWDKCPSTITARIVEIEQHTMTEDERSRTKYLNHLPLTCEFAFCELELCSPILSAETQDIFYEHFQRRKQRRQRKKREEKRLEKKQSKNHSGGIVFSSGATTPEHFHDFLSIASSPPLPSLISSSGIGSTPSSSSSSSSKWGTTTDSNPLSSDGVQQPSFAQALASGDKKLLPQKPIVRVDSPLPFGSSHSHSVGEEDDSEESIPSFQNSFSNALTSTCNVLLSTESQGGKPCGSKAAKKGRKKIVLFSTAGGNHKF